ncbi:50S ribosomal protein L18e, partial [Thermococci archaeon]
MRELKGGMLMKRTGPTDINLRR